jgi:hypothetical protein
LIWHLAALAGRPSHFEKIVSTLGSATIGRFNTLMPDNAGMRLVFLQSTETGHGLFLCKIGEGKRKLLCEELYAQPGAPRQILLAGSG